MPHLAFRQSNELHMEKMLWRTVSSGRTVDCLPMWYYFYHEPIKDPLTIMQHEDGDVELHPGTNRFIGRSLRDDRPWCAARIISIGTPWQRRLTGIRSERLIDARDFDYRSKNDFYSNPELYEWSFGGYAPTDRNWLNMPEEWAQARLGPWGGRLRLTSGRTHMINTQATKLVEVDVRKHEGLTSAVQSLFRKLDKRSAKRDKY